MWVGQVGEAKGVVVAVVWLDWYGCGGVFLGGGRKALLHAQ